MLESIRHFSGTWVAKIILVFLILSFMLFGGFSGIIRGLGAKHYRAVVGGETIGIPELEKAVKRRMRYIQRFNDKITPQQMIESGLEHYVLMELVKDKLIDFEVAKMNIYVSDDRVRESIYASKNFRTENGDFDHEIFKAIVANAGYTEKEFMDQSRREIGRKLLFDSILNGVRVAPLFADIIYDYQFRPREADIVTIPFDSITVPQADDQSLEAFYTQNSHEFRKPESRKVEYYLLSKENVEKLKNIEDLLASGKTLKEVAVEFELKHHTLESVDKNSADAIAKDPAFFETAFSTNEQEDSQFFELKDENWCAVHVDKIRPSFVPEFAKIKTDVVKLEKLGRQKQQAEKIAREGVEAFKEKTQTLKAFAEKHKQKVVTYKDVVRVPKDKKKSSLAPQILERVLAIKFGSYGFIVATDHVLVVSVPRPLQRDEEAKKKDFEFFPDRVDDVVGNDIIEAYLINLQKHYGVEVVK